MISAVCFAEETVVTTDRDLLALVSTVTKQPTWSR